MSDPIGRAEWRRHPRPGEFKPLPVTASTFQPEPCPMAPYAPQEARSAAQEDAPEFPCGWCGEHDEHSTRCPSWTPAPPADVPKQQDDVVLTLINAYATDGRIHPVIARNLRAALASRRPTEADQ